MMINKTFFFFSLVILLIFSSSFISVVNSYICCRNSAIGVNAGDNNNCGNANSGNTAADTCNNAGFSSPTCTGTCTPNLGAPYDGTGSCDVCSLGITTGSCTATVSCNPGDTAGTCTVLITATGTNADDVGNGANFDACCLNGADSTAYRSDQQVCCNGVILDFGIPHQIQRAWNAATDLCCEAGGDRDVWTLNDPGTTSINHLLTCNNQPTDACDSRQHHPDNAVTIEPCGLRQSLPCFNNGNSDSILNAVWDIDRIYERTFRENGGVTNARGLASRFGYKLCSNTCRDLLNDNDHCSECGNSCETGATLNADESKVQDHCDVGICRCDNGCSTSTGYHARRYTRCPQRQFASQFSGWTSSPANSEKYDGGDLIERFGSDPWPPVDDSNPGLVASMMPYENDPRYVPNRAYDYAIWSDTSPSTLFFSIAEWRSFSSNWWGHCPIDILKSPFHCLQTSKPSSSPNYIGPGDRDDPDSYSPYDIDSDSSAKEACRNDCRGNIPMIPCLRKCNRFNKKFRSAVADARANDFTGDAQDVLEDLCSSCTADRTGMAVDPTVPHNVCCEYTIECALYTEACRVNGRKLVERWATDTNSDDYRKAAVPCDERSPVRPGVYREKQSRCGDDDRNPSVPASFRLGDTHIPVSLGNVGVVVSINDDLRAYGAPYAGQFYEKTWNYPCGYEIVGNDPCFCLPGPNPCYCDYGNRRTCNTITNDQRWNTHMIHLIFDPEKTDPTVTDNRRYDAVVNSADWAVLVSDYSDCSDAPNGNVALIDYPGNHQAISWTHTRGHAYVVTALWIGTDDEDISQQTAIVTVTTP